MKVCLYGLSRYSDHRNIKMGSDIEDWRSKIGSFNFAMRNLRQRNIKTDRTDIRGDYSGLFIPALILLLLVSCFAPTLLVQCNEAWPNTHLSHQNVNSIWPLLTGTRTLNITPDYNVSQTHDTVSLPLYTFIINFYPAVTNQYGELDVISGHISHRILKTIVAGDVNPNPGPTKDTCTICKKGVNIGI